MHYSTNVYYYVSSVSWKSHEKVNVEQYISEKIHVPNILQI